MVHIMTKRSVTPIDAATNTVIRTTPVADAPTIWAAHRRRSEMSLLLRFVLVVLGILAVVVGVIYLVEPIHSLPSFLPGHALRGQGHHHTRGYLAIAVGIILMILAGIVHRFHRRNRYA
jgi:hypothetical protein